MNNAPFRYKTIVVNGKMETVLADEGSEYAAEKLARDKRELRDMIAGNVQFFDDPLARPAPPAPVDDDSYGPIYGIDGASILRAPGWYSAYTADSTHISLKWSGVKWLSFAVPLPISSANPLGQRHRELILPEVHSTDNFILRQRKVRLLAGPFAEPTFP
jgi:hypothetical protein